MPTTRKYLEYWTEVKRVVPCAPDAKDTAGYRGPPVVQDDGTAVQVKTTICCRSVAGGGRRECAGARGNKTPCRGFATHPPSATNSGELRRNRAIFDECVAKPAHNPRRKCAGSSPRRGAAS
jgi:hypothetical protein